VVSTPKISNVSTGPRLVLLILGLGLSLVASAYIAVSSLFRPIGVIQKGAEHIGRGNFDYRISKIRRDQLGDLAADINKMAGDVENMLDAKRALLLGISHELRTPLSRIRLELEFVNDAERADSLKAEVAEMEKIVVALVEAERLNGRHEELSRTEVVFGELIDRLIEDFFPREADRFEVDIPADPIVAELDEARVALLFKNLLRNALHYSSPESGLITLAAVVEDGEIVATVSDNGPGLSQDQADHLGEPFYRSDTSRTRESGGTGLGLYLAALVANAHGGSLSLRDTNDQGASFEIRLPMRL
jgi:signal transduction histidine kinase